MRKLIVNADDFALTASCSMGIVELFKLGIVTSTTILTTGEDFVHSMQLAKESGIPLGLHLCLSYGKPILPSEQVSTLVDEKGMFKNIDVLQYEQVDASQVQAEWLAQLEKLSDEGIRPDHLDSHHYVHECLGADIRDVAVRLAKQLGIPLRQGSEDAKDYYINKGIKTTDVFCRDFYGEGVTIGQLKEILARPWQGVMELMCHPGHVDEKIEQISSYSKGRQRELAVLASPEIAAYIKEQNIQLLCFSDL